MLVRCCLCLRCCYLLRWFVPSSILPLRFVDSLRWIPLYTRLCCCCYFVVHTHTFITLVVVGGMSSLLIVFCILVCYLLVCCLTLVPLQFSSSLYAICCCLLNALPYMVGLVGPVCCWLLNIAIVGIALPCPGGTGLFNRIVDIWRFITGHGLLPLHTTAGRYHHFITVDWLIDSYPDSSFWFTWFFRTCRYSFLPGGLLPDPLPAPPHYLVRRSYRTWRPLLRSLTCTPRLRHRFLLPYFTVYGLLLACLPDDHTFTFTVAVRRSHTPPRLPACHAHVGSPTTVRHTILVVGWLLCYLLCLVALRSCWCLACLPHTPPHGSLPYTFVRICLTHSPPFYLTLQPLPLPLVLPHAFPVTLPVVVITFVRIVVYYVMPTPPATPHHPTCHRTGSCSTGSHTTPHGSRNITTTTTHLTRTVYLILVGWLHCGYSHLFIGHSSPSTGYFTFCYAFTLLPAVYFTGSPPQLYGTLLQ